MLSVFVVYFTLNTLTSFVVVVCVRNSLNLYFCDANNNNKRRESVESEVNIKKNMKLLRQSGRSFTLYRVGDHKSIYSRDPIWIHCGLRPICTRWTSQNYTLGFYRISQPVWTLNRHVICHLNGNFVGFQNMYDFKMSDH